MASNKFCEEKIAASLSDLERKKAREIALIHGSENNRVGLRREIELLLYNSKQSFKYKIANLR